MLINLIILFLQKTKIKKNLTISNIFLILQWKIIMRNSIGKKCGEFLSMVEKARRIVLVGHLNPDGDCIGSLTGLGRFIKNRYENKEVAIAVPTPFPGFLNFLDPDGAILVYKNNPDAVRHQIDNCDLLVCMDLGSPSRTENIEPLIRNCTSPKILIDHHLEPENFADLTFSFIDVSSASEITYWLLTECVKGENLPQDVLESLSTGLITDTNNFSNSIFPTTFLMASKITGTGFDIEKIQERVLSSYSQDRMRLMGQMLLNNMIIFDDLHASLMILDLKTQKKFNYKTGDGEGFVNLPLRIGGIKISGLFTEQEGFVRVSLRSKGDISVNELSRRYFNGGGHKNAAGGRVYKGVERIAEYYEKSVREFLAASDTKEKK